MFSPVFGYNLLWFLTHTEGVIRPMNEQSMETQLSSWEEAHPWLSRRAETEEEDSVDEVIRYTLDEIRLS